MPTEMIDAVPNFTQVIMPSNTAGTEVFLESACGQIGRHRI